MDTATTTPAQAAPWGYCILCGRRILSAYVLISAARHPRGGQVYTARAHVCCENLTRQRLTGNELAAGRAAVGAALNAFERLYTRMEAAGLDLAGGEVTP